MPKIPPAPTPIANSDIAPLPDDTAPTRRSVVGQLLLLSSALPAYLQEFMGSPNIVGGSFGALRTAAMTFATVQALLADRLLAYSSTPAGTQVRAGGHDYVVKPANAGDHHIATAGGVKLRVVNTDTATIDAFGATFSGDESAIAQKVLEEHGALRVDAGKVLTCKNVRLSAGNLVDVRGTLKLPDNCADNDRLLYATGADNLTININEIDGNRAGQRGSIGTHLIYLVECVNASIEVDRAHDHYAASNAAMPDPRGEGRNSSTGAIWLFRCQRANVTVRLLSGWSREGIFLEQCVESDVWLGHAQGTLGLEYSGLQVQGTRNRILHASVDNAGASGISFDTIQGVASNIVVTNNRARHGLNLGHPGYPASGSTITNVRSDGAWENGIQVSAGSTDVSISDFLVTNAGLAGLQVSDNARTVHASNGVISLSGRWNVITGGSQVTLTNVRSDSLDRMVLHVVDATGKFVAGETVSGPNGSGTVRKVLYWLNDTKQRLFLSRATGAFSSGDIIVGSVSTARAAISIAGAPTQRRELAGGTIIDDLQGASGAPPMPAGLAGPPSSGNRSRMQRKKSGRQRR